VEDLDLGNPNSKVESKKGGFQATFQHSVREKSVEPSGVQCFDESNPLKDDEASALLDAAVLVLALF